LKAVDDGVGAVVEGTVGAVTVTPILVVFVICRALPV
jgi:hypothetical protein